MNTIEINGISENNPITPAISPGGGEGGNIGGLAGLPVEPSLDAARKWLADAKRFQECNLFCQVMLGFELHGLKKIFGVKNGVKTDISQIGKATIAGWIDLLEAELHISHTTAYRFMNMARSVAAKKVTSFAALRGVDLLNTPIGQLPESAQTALTECVRRITDQRTQRDFLEELGLADSQAEAAAKGGDNEWRRWIENNHPELIDDVGNVPTRMSIRKGNKPVFAEWEAHRLELARKRKAKSGSGIGEMVALANGRLGTLTTDLWAAVADEGTKTAQDRQLKEFHTALMAAKEWVVQVAKEREIKL